jgi:imidazolonepropionase-like amidohydrolase
VAHDCDLVNLVRDLAEHVDDVKVLLTGPVDFVRGDVRGKPQFDADAARLIVGTAREVGKPAFAHCNGVEGLAIAIAAKFDAIEHGYFIDEESLRRMAGEGIAWTPTLAPVAALRDAPRDGSGNKNAESAHIERVLARHAHSICRAAQLGVTLLCGSDAGSRGVPHGSGLIDEMILMVAAGVPMDTVLRGATAVPRVRWGEPSANIVAGAPFRAVALSQSPFQSATALRSVDGILS